MSEAFFNSVERDGVGIIAAERRRQLDRYPMLHDVTHHADDELADAAAVYAMRGSARSTEVMTMLWPDDWAFRPSGDRVRELAKAGALIAAEIDRLVSVAPPETP